MVHSERTYTNSAFNPQGHVTMRLTREEQDKDVVTFISANLLIVAKYKDGRLIRTLGTSVKAESVEMNFVKVTKGDETCFFEIGDNVRWMEVEL